MRTFFLTLLVVMTGGCIPFDDPIPSPAQASFQEYYYKTQPGGSVLP